VSQTARVAQLERFRLKPEVFSDMARRVRASGRLFMASVFDCTTLAQMAPELDAVKIASGDIDFDPLLQVAARCGKPIVMSTGMATLDEMVRALDIIRVELPRDVSVRDRVAVLHCVSLYPTALEQANLAAIPALAAKLNATIGYSDHTLGIDAAIVALALGARVIEKHFTLNKNQSSFRDHALSAEPAELAALARVMRGYRAMLGTGDREQMQADVTNRVPIRRSIVAARDLAEGEILQASDLDYVRPGDGLSPSEAAGLVGRRLRVSLAKHQPIRRENLQ